MQGIILKNLWISKLLTSFIKLLILHFPSNLITLIILFLFRSVDIFIQKKNTSFNKDYKIYSQIKGKTSQLILNG